MRTNARYRPDAMGQNNSGAAMMHVGRLLRRLQGRDELVRPIPVSSPPAASFEVVRLASLIPDVPGKRDFARQVDTFQQCGLAELAAAYCNTGFAKLIMLKAGNLLLARHGYHHRHTVLASRPTQIMLDPANTCQLQCPGCVHSPGATGRLPDRDGASPSFDWPKGIMPLATFDRIIVDPGPYAFAAILYNYGEPLLHREFPNMVRRAKGLGMYTWTSPNLSLSFDVDAVVGSGFDLLTMSIDGTSQDTLQRYRRRARWALCLANMRALAAAKQRTGQGPHLVWQFLTFEHNCHEVPQAIALAQEIGVDELHVGTPFDVSWDDPGISVHRSDLAKRYIFHEDRHLQCAVDPAQLAIDETALDRRLADRLADRLDRLGIAEEPSRAGRPACDWLYQNVTFDAVGRVMPCCAAPTTQAHLHFASLGDDAGAVANSDAFRRARLSIADRSAYDAEAGCGKEPYCARCETQPNLNFPTHPHVGMLLRCLDHGRVFDEPAIAALTDWETSVTGE